MKQSEALSILKMGVNVFLTGEPGSGKTFVVNEYVKYLYEHDIPVAVTASTGIAATHLNGVTIHSWSGIGVKKFISDEDLMVIKAKKWLVNRIKNVSVLIIDEISMLEANLLTAIDKVLRSVRENDLPFGGVQVVLVGDFFQLPPVTRESEKADFAFASSSWTEAKMVVCYLSEQHRQSGDQLTLILKSIRSFEDVEVITSALSKQISKFSADETVTRLYTHNVDVDRINLQKLAQLPGKEHEYEMTTHGRKKLVEQLKKSCLSVENLVLKKGARVIFIKNNYEVGYVNGTQGTVIGFEDGYPVVETLNGDVIQVFPEEWLIDDNGKRLASLSQIPLRLAWAITVHKSQGMTLDAAFIDLSESFEYGQGYVAISRVKSITGLFLQGFNQRALQIHPEIIRVDKEFLKRSQLAEVRLNNYSENDLVNKHMEFILKTGGEIKPIKQKSKTSTYDKTLLLYQSGKSVAEIANERNLTEGTILNHLEKLKMKDRLTNNELERVVPPYLSKSLPAIHQIFNEMGYGKLGPVYAKLHGQYSYEDLRLARLVF